MSLSNIQRKRATQTTRSDMDKRSFIIKMPTFGEVHVTGLPGGDEVSVGTHGKFSEFHQNMLNDYLMNEGWIEYAAGKIEI